MSGTVLTTDNGGAVGTTSLNVLAGQLEEIIDRPVALRLAAVSGPPTGAKARATWNVGKRIALQDANIPFTAAAASPLLPDHEVCRANGRPPERQSLFFRNPGTAAVEINWLVDVVYLR